MTKFIVATGASKGIGRAAVDALVDDGWSVIGSRERRQGTFQEPSSKPISRITARPGLSPTI
jgi:NAD(P)-dependent dehydrogenase (short-subunit alcohol dehydrogenase family)